MHTTRKWESIILKEDVFKDTEETDMNIDDCWKKTLTLGIEYEGVVHIVKRSVYYRSYIVTNLCRALNISLIHLFIVTGLNMWYPLLIGLREFVIQLINMCIPKKCVMDSYDSWDKIWFATYWLAAFYLPAVIV